MAFVEMPPQHFHRRIVFHALERLNRTAVAHDRKSQTRAGGLSIHSDRAGATSSVFTTKMGGCQAAAFPQEIREGFPRLHVIGDFGAVQFEGH